MLFLFLFFFKSKSETDHMFRNLADKALETSKYKIPKQERYEKTIPGDYSLDDAKFTLRRTLVTPKTKDIKGFAIEKQYLALVKRKTFNLDDDFAFIDPSNQKYYSISAIVSSDEQVNIYSTKEITIFDLLTNFKYNRKSMKEYTPTFDIDWNESEKFPVLHTIGNTTSKVSLGIKGTFSNDITMTFNTKSDVYISSKLELNAQILSEIQLQKNNLSEVTDTKLFEREPLSMNGFDFEFEFRGIKIQIKPFIKGEISLIDDLYSQLEESIDLYKEYEIHGTKTFEITNYAFIDPKWNLEIIQKQEKYLSFSTHVPKNVTFKITPELTLYYSTEIMIGELKTVFDTGLTTSIKFEFETYKDDLIRIGISGEVCSKIQSFHKLDEMNIQFPSSYKNTKTIALIKSSNDKVPLKEITTGKHLIQTANMLYEQDSNSIQNVTFPNYSLVETTSLHLKKAASYYNQLHIVIFPIKGKFDKQVCFPYIPLSTTPTKYNYNLFVPFDYFSLTPSTQEYSHIKDVLVRVDIIQYISGLGYIIDVRNSQYNECKSEIQSRNDKSNSMIGNFGVWKCQKIQINKVFHLNGNSYPFTTFENTNEKYALLLIDGKYGSKVDENAQFFPEAGSEEDYNQKGIYSPPNKAYYEISHSSYTKLYDNLLNVYANITLIKTKNGKSVSQFIGVTLAASDSLLYRSFAFDNDLLKFMLDEGETVELKADFQLTRYYIKDPSSPHIDKEFVYQTATLAHSDIVGKSTLSFIVPGYCILKFNISKIELPVAIKHNFKDAINNQSVITKVREIDIDIKSKAQIPFEEDEFYYILKVKSHKYPMKSCYLFMKTTQIIILSQNIKTIGNDIYYIYCESDTVLIPIRRKSGKGTFNIEFLIAETEDPQNMRINKAGSSFLFKGSNIAKALIIDTNMNKYYIDNAKIPLTYYSIDIDSNSKLYGIINPNNIKESVSIIPTYAYLEVNQTSTEIDLRELYSIAKASGKENFSFHLFCEWKEVSTIRMINQNYETESKVENNIATFTIEISPDKEIDSPTQFIPICSDANAINCALTFIAGGGRYQLIKFPNKEGLNTTGRGHLTSIINASANEPYYYHKLFKGKFTYIRSYSEKTPVKMTITDVYPYDKIETNTKVIQEDDNPIMVTKTPVSHNLKDAYREFCLKDHFKNSLPFSVNYFTNNYEEFFEHLGVNKNIDDSQFTINDKDECIKVDIQMIEKDIEKVTNKLIDLGTTYETIPVEYIVANTDTEVEDQSKDKEKTKTNNNVIYIAIIGVSALVIIVVVIVAVVCILKRNDNNHKNKTKAKKKQKFCENDISSDKQSEDDKYVSSLL